MDDDNHGLGEKNQTEKKQKDFGKRLLMNTLKVFCTQTIHYRR